MEEKPICQCPSLFKEVTSHPLFSILTTFLLLTLLYLPSLLHLIFSPIFITTSVLLATLLHFGSPKPETPQKDPGPDPDPDPDPIPIQPENRQAPLNVELNEQKENIFNSLVEWGRRGGPLEVIYEEYEGEEEGNSPEYSQMMLGTASKRLDGIGCCSTESDADSDDSLDDMFFRWDEEEEGMIEIALEEDNLIEIDLSACRMN